MYRILKRLCGEPMRQDGSHRHFVSPGGVRFTFGYHDSAEIPGAIVRRILVQDVGLTPKQARKEVS
jgi:predicted RNA binding protein YcfA (HicA-like mRNA interferase family)